MNAIARGPAQQHFKTLDYLYQEAANQHRRAERRCDLLTSRRGDQRRWLEKKSINAKSTAKLYTSVAFKADVAYGAVSTQQAVAKQKHEIGTRHICVLYLIYT